MNCFFRLVLAGVAAAFLSFSPVVAQVSDSGAIRDIVIQGNQRIEPETIRSYLSITEGETFSSSRVDRALKSLFATGLFADVSIHREGDSLIVSVVENPIINRLAF
ncbi:MAG: FtsQ-type POTRA domain-containing protein, partial [Rhodospirillaceae bacterium]|nr:FtsQ-type POTRA domain-containing protein [Rhodospirillaceae bacterium]